MSVNINLKGKKGIIFGLANQRSIAWAISEKLFEAGAELAFTYLDERLLNRILDRKSHWNNAEIGCHIEIDRKPNIYEIDSHTMMQFFHL